LVSGLRAPGLAGAKRAGANGLARPSSGYYSLSVKTAPEAETPEVGQHKKNNFDRLKSRSRLKISFSVNLLNPCNNMIKVFISC